jgi:hypothetical protein
MKTQFLFPHQYKKIGWILVGLSAIVLLLPMILHNDELYSGLPVFYVFDSDPPENQSYFFNFKRDSDIGLELFLLFSVTGSLFVGFSSLKKEDEFTLKLRLESLLWAVYSVFSLFLFAAIFVYGTIGLELPLYGWLVFLLIFIARFHYVLYQTQKNSSYEK